MGIQRRHMDFAVADTGADDTAALQAMIDSFGPEGGTLRIFGRCNIDGDLTVKPHVTLRGDFTLVGTGTSNDGFNFSLLGSTLRVSPTATIRLKSSAGLQGLLIHRKGMTFPTTDLGAYAGTAITSEGDDVFVLDSAIFGFNKAFYSVFHHRPRLERLALDNTNGIEIVDCYDIAHVTHCHAWPYATIQTSAQVPSSQRAGVAFKFMGVGDWSRVTNCFAFGYFRGYQITNCVSMTLLGCGADGFVAAVGGAPGCIGFLVSGNANDLRMIGCQGAAQDHAVNLQAAAGKHILLLGCHFWSNTNHGVMVAGPDATILGCSFRGSGLYGIAYVNAASRLFVDHCRFEAVGAAAIASTVAATNIHIGENNDYVASVPFAGTYALRQVAAASTLALPASGSVFEVTGDLGIATITGGWANRRVMLKFTGSPIVTDGSNLKLAGNFTAAPNATLGLVCDGVNWCEMSRSAN